MGHCRGGHGRGWPIVEGGHGRRASWKGEVPWNGSAMVGGMVRGLGGHGW